jgi:hypothetical protein
MYINKAPVDKTITNGLSKDGGRGGAKFDESLRACSFDKDTLNDNTFSQIHLAG